MILSDVDIKKVLEAGTVNIDPKPDYGVQLGSCSLDLQLGSKFRVFNHSKVAFIDPNDPKDANLMMSEITVEDSEPFILQPSDFVLATTLENVTLPDNLVGRLEGRSSLGRLGIVVHSTASIIDPGFSGVIVMELGNMGRMPVALYPGMRICALTFEQLSTSAQIPYSQKKLAKYSHQDAPLASKIGEEK
jgi:dCTP deaminase